MFFSSPSADLKIIIFCLVFAFVISLITYVVSKKILATVFMFSVLSNLVFYGNSGSRLVVIYNLNWVVSFALDYWPWINLLLFVLLIINFVKNKKCQKIKAG